SIGQGGATTRLLAGRIDGCRVEGDASWAMQACFGMAVGRVLSDGFGYSPAYAPRPTWIAAVARFETPPRVFRNFGLSADLEGIVPLLLPILDVRTANGNVVATEHFPPFGGAIAVGPRVEF